jgi:predicted amidohydrolase YtcJ
MEDGLLLRNVEVGGRPGLDVRLQDGLILETGRDLRTRGPQIEGNGGALIPGLIDHHAHLFAMAAESGSVRLNSASRAGVVSALKAADEALGAGDWMRVVGYSDADTDLLDRLSLDSIVSERPVRVQHCSGAVWILNSMALSRLAPEEADGHLERDAGGEPTGRLWRGDDWLRARLAALPPSLQGVSDRLAAFGITGITDASVTNDGARAAIFASAVRRGELKQTLCLMSGGALDRPEDDAFRVGPVKILLDDHDLPDFDEVTRTIAWARTQGRAVAVHCVTAGELAFILAAFAEAGATGVDRIEHGGVVHLDTFAEIARLGLTVVTQPAFVFENGDRYLDTVDPADAPFLYPCGALIRAGIRVAAGSDAPYATSDPWRAMAAATQRRTRGGRSLGDGERISPPQALRLFLGDFGDPGGAARRVEVGSAADLCLLDRPIDAAMSSLDVDMVAATLVGGRTVHERR